MSTGNAKVTSGGGGPGFRPAGPRAAAMALLCTLAVAAPAGAGADGPPADSRATAGQDPAEAVMITAGRWVAERLPGGVARLDPHRSGAGVDGARLERVARALGAGLVRLEDAQHCADVMDPSTCEFSGGALLAIAMPRVAGEEASVKVYAWHGSDSLRRPVTKRTWELELRRNGDEWRVVSGG